MRKILAILLATAVCFFFCFSSTVHASDVERTSKGLLSKVNRVTILNKEAGIATIYEEFFESCHDFALFEDKIYLLDSVGSKIIMFNANGEKVSEKEIDEYPERIFCSAKKLIVICEDHSVRLFDADLTEFDRCKISKEILPCNVVKVDYEADKDSLIINEGYAKKYLLDLHTGICTEICMSDYKCSVEMEYYGNYDIIVNYGCNKLSFDSRKVLVQPIGVDESGNMYQIAAYRHESRDAHELDYCIERYDNNGVQSGCCVLDFTESKWIPLNIAVLYNNDIYVLYCTEDSTIIQRECIDTFDKRTASLYEKDRISDSENGDMAAGTRATTSLSLTRDQVQARAESMIQTTWIVSSANKTVSSSSVTLPSYVNNATVGSTLTGIPYCWGGFNGYDVNSFSSMVSENYTAGNVNTSSPGHIGGTIGVDCSGYVSSAYGFSTKYGTTGLASYGTAISQSNMQKMDFMVKSGSHVVLYFTVSGVNYVVDDASTSRGKAACRTLSPSTFSSYQARTPW